MHEDNILQHSLQQRDLDPPQKMQTVMVTSHLERSNAAVIWLCELHLTLFSGSSPSRLP